MASNIPTELKSTVDGFSADLKQKVTEWLNWDKVFFYYFETRSYFFYFFIE